MYVCIVSMYDAYGETLEEAYANLEEHKKNGALNHLDHVEMTVKGTCLDLADHINEYKE